MLGNNVFIQVLSSLFQPIPAHCTQFKPICLIQCFPAYSGLFHHSPAYNSQLSPFQPKAYSSQFKPMLCHFSSFQSIVANSSIFRHDPAYSGKFQPLFSLFQPIPAHSRPFQPIPDHSSQFQIIADYSSHFHQITPNLDHWSLLQPILDYSKPFQSIPATLRQFQPIAAHWSLFESIPAYCKPLYQARESSTVYA